MTEEEEQDARTGDRSRGLSEVVTQIAPELDALGQLHNFFRKELSSSGRKPSTPGDQPPGGLNGLLADHPNRDGLNLLLSRTSMGLWSASAIFLAWTSTRISDSNPTTRRCFGSGRCQQAHHSIQTLWLSQLKWKSDIPTLHYPCSGPPPAISSSSSSQRQPVLQFWKCKKAFLGQRDPSGSSWISLVSISPPCCVDSQTSFFAMDTLL
jgi:hypothetical protein